MNQLDYQIEPLAPEHVEKVVTLWRASMAEALGIEPIHSFDSQAYFLEHILPVDYQVVVAIHTASAEPVAFMASSENEVNQLYVSPGFQGQGIGSYLLKLAKKQSNGSLYLRTHEVNTRARSFYEAHDFVLTTGGCNNEEGLPDLECRWQELE